MDSKVLYRDCLTGESLSRLFNDEALAIVVRNYIQTDWAQKIGTDISTSPDLEEYYYEVSNNGDRKRMKFGVSRLGISFNTTYGRTLEEPEVMRYYENALPNINKIRSLFHPYISPIDKLRLNLEEIWHGDVNIATFQGRKMFTGIARVTHPNCDTLEKKPHVDSIPPNFCFDLVGQFSANVFLTVPESGGELVLWDGQSMTPAQIDDLDTNQKIWDSNLERGVAIKPLAGDLIVINTRKLHAVKQFSLGTRVSLQTFIGVLEDQRLKLWC